MHDPGPRRAPVPRLCRRGPPRVPPGSRPPDRSGEHPPARFGDHGAAGDDRRHVRGRGHRRRTWLVHDGPIGPEADQPRRLDRPRATPERRPGGHRRGAGMAARFFDVPARRLAPHRVQRVRVVDLRHGRGGGTRQSPIVVDLLLHRPRRERGLVRVRAADGAGGWRLGGHLRDLRGLRHVQLPSTAPGDRRGSAPRGGHARRDQHGPRPLDPRHRLARARRRLHRRAVRRVRGRGCRLRVDQEDDPGRGLRRPARDRVGAGGWRTAQVHAEFPSVF